jgi:hypothetical protein
MAEVDLANEFLLTPQEAVILTIGQAWMLKQDVMSEHGDKERNAKRRVQQAFRKETIAAITALGEKSDGLPWETGTFTGDGWVERFATVLASRPSREQSANLEAASTIDTLVGNLVDRKRCLLLLIEWYAFQPWDGKAHWSKKTRLDSLRHLAECMPHTSEGDFTNVDQEFNRALKTFARSNMKWGRIALLAAAGLGLGILTAGLAAPLIGAAVGAAMGLSGAAATTAGLALLGGGSLAAGGLGMAGGTALIAGVGGVAGATAAASTGQLTGWTSGQIVTDAITLRVLTRLVVLDEEGDDAKARFIVRSLQVRLAQVEALHDQVMGKLADAKQKLEASDVRIKDLEDEVTRLKEEGSQLNVASKAVRQQIQAIEKAVDEG